MEEAVIDHWWKFDGLNFEPFESPLSDDEIDWGKAVRLSGYHRRWALGGEFDVCQVEVYFRQAQPNYMIEVMINGTGGMTCVFDNEPLAMLYFRDHCLPLLALNNHRSQEEFFKRALEVLFDPEIGLGCAQRMGWREEAQRKEDMRAARKKREADEKKAAE